MPTVEEAAELPPLRPVSSKCEFNSSLLDTLSVRLVAKHLHTKYKNYDFILDNYILKIGPSVPRSSVKKRHAPVGRMSGHEN